MGAFSKAISLIEKTTLKNADAYKESFAVEMLAQIARDTPVDTGKATAAWTLSAGSPDKSQSKFKDISLTAMPTRQRAEKAARKAPPKATLFVSNNVVGDEGEGYIIGLEHGKSKQSAPGMMFGKNIAMAPLIAKRALKKIGL